MAASERGAIAARLDRLPAVRELWALIALISLGACFEMYDLFQNAYLTPGLINAGVFKENGHAMFGLSDQAIFVSATFAGLFVGTILFAQVADRYGRKKIFTISLLWYTAANIFMGLQGSAFGIDFWRFVGGIGIGVEIVTIDVYISELAPKEIRGRAFAFSQAIQFAAIPVLAFLCWLLVPRAPLGIAGWRWVVFIGSIGAVVVWFIRRKIPESPRWLAAHGQVEEAARVVSQLEHRIESRTGRNLDEPNAQQLESTSVTSTWEIWSSTYRTRTIMLVVFNFFQTIGFYGFGNWVPALIAAQGATVIHSLKYSAIIAVAFPLGPLLCMQIADRFERKSQIIFAALCTAIFGLVFTRQTTALAIILCGVAITFSNNLLSYAYHAYQAELYPTSIRARAVGFVYSWSRLSTVFTSLMIGFFLEHFGSNGVFTFIAVSMLICVLVVGTIGPKTRGVTLEELSS